VELLGRAAVEKLLRFIGEQEALRARTARVLHDQVSQVLSAAGLQLDVLRMDFQAGHPELAARTAEIQQLLERAIDEVRGLSRELDPSMVERAGLSASLNRLVGRIRQNSGLNIRLLLDPAAHMPPAAAAAFYRIAEQALDNVVRHAGGAAAEVLLRPTREGTVLEIRDAGKGFDLEQERASRRGLGLVLMEFHAARAGVDFSVTSSPGQGTIVKAVCRTEPDELRSGEE